jgi:WD40 repeat protein
MAIGKLAIGGVLEGHAGAIWGVSLSADSRLLGSAHVDGTVRLWETTIGTCLRTLRPERCYEPLDITGLTGITEARRQALLALRAVERPG